MIRIKDPKISVPFYEKHFGEYLSSLWLQLLLIYHILSLWNAGFTLICERHFPEMGFSLYFMAREPEGMGSSNNVKMCLGIVFQELIERNLNIAGKELPDPKSDEGWKYCMSIRGTAIELTQ